jgi:hypothetical protein
MSILRSIQLKIGKSLKFFQRFMYVGQNDALSVIKLFKLKGNFLFERIDCQPLEKIV